MTDEKDPKNSGRTPEDDLYGAFSDSGVHRLIKVYDESLPRHEGRAVPTASVVDIRQFVELRLRLQDIYGIRKNMRDAFRNFAEKNQWLGDVLGVEHIPKISAQKIAEEEDARMGRRLKKFGKKDMGIHPLSVYGELAKSEMSKDPEVMSAEEYAKYLAGKHKHLLEKGDFRKWRNVMLDVRFRFKNDNERHAFYEVIKFEAEKAFTEALKNGDAKKITDGLMYLGGIELFKPADLLDVPKEILESAEVQMVFIEMLAGFFQQHPELFFKVRKHLMQLGVFEEKTDIDGHPLIVAVAKKTLYRALHFDQAVFMRYRKLYADEKFELQWSQEEEAAMRETVFQRLRQAACESPGRYMALRKQLELLGIMEEGVADIDDEVRWTLLGHRLRWEEIHPWALGKLRHYWRANGLQVMDEVSLEDFADHDNEQLRKDPRRSVPIGYGPIPREMRTDLILQKALNYFEYEKEEYEEFGKNIERLSMDYLDADARKLRETQLRYPQYYEKNNGKGYNAHQLTG